MYNEEYFYGISDLMHFNVYASLLKDDIKLEERVIIKVFKKGKQVVVIENNKGKDIILKDTREDKNDDLMTYDLIFLKTLERYVSDYEMPNMIYEYIEGVGSWYRVKVKGYNPEDKIMKPFFLKKVVPRNRLFKYCNSPEDLEKLNKFWDLTNGIIKFSKPNDVKKLFSVMEK